MPRLRLYFRRYPNPEVAISVHVMKLGYDTLLLQCYSPAINVPHASILSNP